MNTINLSKVTDIIQELIAEITNSNKETIFLRFALRGDNLKFNQPGIRTLANKLNNKFKAQNLELKHEMLSEQETVEDLIDLVWDKIPKSKKMSC